MAKVWSVVHVTAYDRNESESKRRIMKYRISQRQKPFDIDTRKENACRCTMIVSKRLDKQDQRFIHKRSEAKVNCRKASLSRLELPMLRVLRLPVLCDTMCRDLREVVRPRFPIKNSFWKCVRQKPSIRQSVIGAQKIQRLGDVAHFSNRTSIDDGIKIRCGETPSASQSRINALKLLLIKVIRRHRSSSRSGWAVRHIHLLILLIPTHERILKTTGSLTLTVIHRRSHRRITRSERPHTRLGLRLHFLNSLLFFVIILRTGCVFGNTRRGFRGIVLWFVFWGLPFEIPVLRPTHRSRRRVQPSRSYRFSPCRLRRSGIGLPLRYR